MTKTNEDNNNQTKLPFKQNHAFIIGINDYDYLPKLRTAVNDAQKISEVLSQQQGFTVHPPLLDASYKRMKYLLEKTILKKVKKDDRVFFYFAGHGIALDGENGLKGYIIPADARYVKDASDIENKIIPMQTLHDILTSLPCQHLLLVLDCCFAGSFRWSSRYRYSGGFMPKRIFKERFDRFVKDPAWQVLTSSAYDQSALDVLQEKPIGKRDEEDMLHSPFAKALIQGLEGAADIIPAEGGDGLITASELYLYIRQQVEPQTIEMDEDKRQTPGIFPLQRHGKGEYIFLHPKHRLNLPPVPKRNPYKGLQSFEEADMDLFYGRERVINELMQTIDENNLIVVTGASGTGKSSVVKAGLLPRLRQQGYHILPVIRPGKTPAAALEMALNESKFFAGDVTLAKHLETVSEKLTMYKNILVIDQYEELITQCNKETRQRFAEILRDFLDKNKKNLFKIILTVRADFEPQFKGSALESYWQDGRYTVPPFTTGELREIIVKPTYQEVLYIEPPGLVDRIIHEVVQAPGALPLLSYTLSEWCRLYSESGRTNRELHENDYKKLGGVIGALQTCADTLYKELDTDHRDTMRKIMLRMVTLEGGEPAGKRVLVEDLEFSEEENKRVESIISQLLDARLILKGTDTEGHIFIEPAHDVLIKSWGTLWDWRRLHGEDILSLQDRLDEAVKDYQNNKDKKYLWHENPRLELLKEELQSPGSCLNRNETSFVKESVKIKEQKRKRSTAIRISVITVLSIFLVIVVYFAVKASIEARIAKSRYYTSQAQLALRDDPTIAIRLAERAYQLHKHETALQILSAAAATTLDHPFYNVIMKHGDHVNDVVFSPSGQQILTVSSDKTAKLWNLQGSLLKTFPHNNVVYSARFSPGGTEILTVSRDKTAKLWDLHGNFLGNFAHKKIVTSAVFSPDGRSILTASQDKTAKLWDLQGSLLKDYRHDKGVETAFFSPDGTTILTITNERTPRLSFFGPTETKSTRSYTVTNDKTAWLWDLQGSLIKKLDRIICVEFSPKGQGILVIYQDNSIKILGPDGSVLKELGEHPGITIAKFSPGGTRVIAARYDDTKKQWDLHLWDLTTNHSKLFPVHTENINSLVFSPEGSRILTASSDKTAKLWDLNGNLIADFDKHKDRVTAAAFSPGGRLIITASHDKTARLWDLQDQLVTDFRGHTDEVYSAVFSPEGTRILTGSRDNTAKLWDLQGNLLADFNGHKGIVNSAVFSPDGSKILTTSADKTARLWNRSGSPLKDFKHMDNVNSAIFSPDGTKILTASYDHTVKLWDLQGILLKDFKHTDNVNSAVFSPDGTRILTASYDKTARLWDLEGNVLANFSQHDWPVEMAIFSPSGTHVLTISVIVRLWDLKSRQLIKFRRKPKDTGLTRGIGDAGVNFAVFSPDGTRVLTASNDNKAELWTLEGNRLLEFNGHKSIVKSAVFSPDGTRILTASADGTVKMWDLQGNMLSDFDRHKGIVNSVVFSPDGTRILNASADKTAKLWYTPAAIMQWLKTAKIPKLPNEEIK